MSSRTCELSPLFKLSGFETHEGKVPFGKGYSNEESRLPLLACLLLLFSKPPVVLCSSLFIRFLLSLMALSTVSFAHGSGEH